MITDLTADLHYCCQTTTATTLLLRTHFFFQNSVHTEPQQALHSSAAAELVRVLAGGRSSAPQQGQRLHYVAGTDRCDRWTVLPGMCNVDLRAEFQPLDHGAERT
jgi:hypothetical protein